MSTVETDPPKAQRHLAAIVAADIVGYSRQMEKDEVGTLGRLRDLRQNLIEPKVAEHRGRVFKTTGDGFLAEFVSVLEAVHCAVDIQRLMAARNLDLPEAGRVQLRIGVNLGDVFHEGDDVFGDGVNIAARLESIAPPGGIYISRAACDPIRDRLAFDFEDLGEHQVKNIARPIHVYGVRIDGVAEKVIVEPPRRRPAFSGRVVGTVSILVAIAVVAVLVWTYLPNSPTNPQVATAPVTQAQPAPAPQSAPAPQPQPPPQPKIDPEVVLWESISSSNNAADFEEYLRKYPNGQFVGLARNRLAELHAPPAATPRPSREVSAAEAVRAGRDAFLQKDYAKSFHWYQQAADQGDATAQFWLGYLYAAGIGVPQDLEQARAWMRKAAAAGVAPASDWLKLH